MAAEKVFSIIANKSWGLYYGEVIESSPDGTGTMTVKAANVRHVCRWYGKTGGITSLARHGLCGSDAKESRIGAPVEGISTLCGIVNVFPCSAEAVATFDAAEAK